MVAPDGNHVHVLSMGGTIDKDYPRLTAGYANLVIIIMINQA